MKRRKGYTLIELVVAGSLFAYFTMLLMELNVQSSRVGSRLVGRTTVLVETKVAYRHLAADIDGAQNATWNGAGNLLQITTADASVVEYYVDEGRLFRRRYGDTDGILVARGVTEWTARTTTFSLEIGLTLSTGPLARRVLVHRSFRQT